MPEIRPEDVAGGVLPGQKVDDPDGAKSNLQAWIVSQWMKRRMGVPAEYVTVERISTVILAYSYLTDLIAWFFRTRAQPQPPP